MSFSKDNDLYHNADENRYKEIRENINQANKRMEQIEKIFEVLTNDTRLKDIIEELNNKNHNNKNKKYFIRTGRETQSINFSRRVNL